MKRPRAPEPHEQNCEHKHDSHDNRDDATNEPRVDLAAHRFEIKVVRLGATAEVGHVESRIHAGAIGEAGEERREADREPFAEIEWLKKNPPRQVERRAERREYLDLPRSRVHHPISSRGRRTSKLSLRSASLNHPQAAARGMELP